MKGLRIFDRFPKKPKGARLIDDFHEWIFLPEYHDWHSAENELVLSAYSPPNELINLLKNNIDIKME